MPSTSTLAEPASGSTASSSLPVATVRLSPGASCRTRRPQYLQPADSGVITRGSPSAPADPAGRRSGPAATASDADTRRLQEPADLFDRRHRVGAEEARGHDRA